LEGYVRTAGELLARDGDAVRAIPSGDLDGDGLLNIALSAYDSCQIDVARRMRMRLQEPIAAPSMICPVTINCNSTLAFRATMAHAP
jgi:hypothetical protein